MLFVCDFHPWLMLLSLAWLYGPKWAVGFEALAKCLGASFTSPKT